MGAATETAVLPDVTGMSNARRRLYTTALLLFAEHGYHAVSVRDITDELGQQPGAFYAHARSKQELLAELVRIGVTEHRDRLRAAVLEAADDPVEQLRALVRAHVLVHLEYPALARVFSREVRSLDPEQQASLAGIVSEARLELLAVIARGQTTQVFGDVDTVLVATVLGDIGVRLPEWWTPEFPRTRDQIADTYAEFALKLLG